MVWCVHLHNALGLKCGAVDGRGRDAEVGAAAHLGGQFVLNLARLAGERHLAHEVPVLGAVVFG